MEFEGYLAEVGVFKCFNDVSSLFQDILKIALRKFQVC